MKATDLLLNHHKKISSLFKRIEKANKANVKRSLFEELAALLVAHDAIEREIFYPACEKQMGLTEELGEALVEHGLVEFSLYQADQSQKKDDFDFKCTVLEEVVDHHVEEEEDEFFPKVKKAFEKEALERLGARMEAAFKDALRKDFRAPLYRNLEQVLAGALKTKPGTPKAVRTDKGDGRAEVRT